MYNIVIAIKVWGHLWQDKVVLVSCDDQGAVIICELGRTRDQFLNRCLHTFWRQAAHYNIDIHVIHVPGKKNEIADALSCWTFRGIGYDYGEITSDDFLHVSL